MERVITYIDGFNLYYGLRSKGWKWFYWLNLQALAESLLKPGQELKDTKYFTSVVRKPPGKHARQALFLEALQTLKGLHIYYGHFLADTVMCRQCGHTYETHHEKMTDVNIAIELMTDAFQNTFDTALVISADSDLVGPIQSVRRLFPDKRIVAAFPPDRYSGALKSVASGFLVIGRDKFSKSVFPDEVRKPNGFILRRPAEWR